MTAHPQPSPHRALPLSHWLMSPHTNQDGPRCPHPSGVVNQNSNVYFLCLWGRTPRLMLVSVKPEFGSDPTPHEVTPEKTPRFVLSVLSPEAQS